LQDDIDVIGIGSHASNDTPLEPLVEPPRMHGMSDVPGSSGGSIPQLTGARLIGGGVAAVVLLDSAGTETGACVRRLARAPVAGLQRGGG
jgi:hypothetical protein